MSMQDPIADMFTRIRNGGTAPNKKDIAMPTSKLKVAIAAVLKKEGYIIDYREDGEGVNKQLLITLKYVRKVSVIESIKRLSKPSCRIYCGSTDIPNVRNGLGIVILSTPKGILSGNDAKAENVGGEILCQIW